MSTKMDDSVRQRHRLVADAIRAHKDDVVTASEILDELERDITQRALNNWLGKIITEQNSQITGKRVGGAAKVYWVESESRTN